jgi:hypothetical protein
MSTCYPIVVHGQMSSTPVRDYFTNIITNNDNCILIVNWVSLVIRCANLGSSCETSITDRSFDILACCLLVNGSTFDFGIFIVVKPC